MASSHVNVLTTKPVYMAGGGYNREASTSPLALLVLTVYLC